MDNTFETGGAYLLRLRKHFGCLTAPTFSGIFLMIFVAEDLGAILFTVSGTFILGAVLVNVIRTKSDGTLRLDERGIWIEQMLNPIVPAKKQISKTLVAWDAIRSVDVGYGEKNKQRVAPIHVPIEAERLMRKPSFMTHMSRRDWSLMIDIGQQDPVHIYAANMNDGPAAGAAIGQALWNRNLIEATEQEPPQN